METLIISIEFSSGLAGEHLATLDAILAGELALEIGDEAALARLQEIVKHTDGTPQASQIMLREAAPPSRIFPVARLEHEWAQTPRHVTGTPRKPRQNDYTVRAGWMSSMILRSASQAVYAVTGDADAIEAILENVPAIGRRRASGFGRIAYLSVDPVDADPDTWGLADQSGRIMRPVPGSIAARLGLTIERVEATRSRPFYWSNETPNNICAVPISHSLDDFDFFGTASAGPGITAPGGASDPFAFFRDVFGQHVLKAGDRSNDLRDEFLTAMTKAWPNTDPSKPPRRISSGSELFILRPDGVTICAAADFGWDGIERRGPGEGQRTLTDLLLAPADRDALVLQVAKANPNSEYVRLSKTGSDIVWLCISGEPPLALSRRQFQALVGMNDLKACRKARNLLDERLQTPENAASIDAKLAQAAKDHGVSLNAFLAALPPSDSRLWALVHNHLNPKQWKAA